jgi:sugar transferase (PEP-CTERM system associated)
MIRLFRQYIPLRKAIFITGEGVLIFAAVSLASLYFLGMEPGLAPAFETIWFKAIVIALMTQISLYFNDLYEFKANRDLVDVASRLIQSIGVASICLAIVYLIWPEMIIGRWVFFASTLVFLFLIVSWRILYAFIIKKKLLTERTIIVGSGELAAELFRAISEKKDLSYDIRSVVTHEKNKTPADPLTKIPIHHGFDGICELAEAEKAGSVIVALDEKRGTFPYKELLKCRVRGINIIDGESFYERIAGKLLVEKINPSWLIFSDGFVKSPVSRFVKRVVGLVMSTVMLILAFPVLILVALAIKLSSPGPAFFSQERVGEFGKPFTLYKFRSMIADAEKESGPVWATEDDPRITKIGKIIRKLRIDELPQLWNVFKGDMSFVGPRPERQHFVDQLKEKIPYYNERFSVKPGVTGWAQVMYTYGASEEDALEKLKYDLYYIKNMSLVMDLVVIFHTVKIVLLGRGSR